MLRGNRCVLLVFIDGTGLTGLGLGSDGDGLTATGIPILGAKPGIYHDPNHIRNKIHLIRGLEYFDSLMMYCLHIVITARITHLGSPVFGLQQASCV